MKPSAPKIGFDRFIDMAWVVEALKVRAGLSDTDRLTSLVREKVPGLPGQKKVRTVLNRMWLEPRPELTDFATRGAVLFRENPRRSALLLGWGMAIATYPFFARTAEIVGRLAALHGDCTSAEVHRRMSEDYGEREGTYRMTNMALQTQANWGLIDRTAAGTRIKVRSKMTVGDNGEIAWLTEACLRNLGHPINVASLESLPILYPFRFEQSVAYILSRSPGLELRTEGTTQPMVALRKLESRTSVLHLTPRHILV